MRGIETKKLFSGVLSLVVIASCSFEGGDGQERNLKRIGLEKKIEASIPLYSGLKDLKVIGYDGELIELNNSNLLFYGASVASFFEDSLQRLMESDVTLNWTQESIGLTIVHYVHIQNLEDEIFFQHSISDTALGAPLTVPRNVMKHFPCKDVYKCEIVIAKDGMSAVEVRNHSGSFMSGQCFILVNQSEVLQEMGKGLSEVQFESFVLTRAERYQKRIDCCLGYFLTAT